MSWSPSYHDQPPPPLSLTHSFSLSLSLSFSLSLSLSLSLSRARSLSLSHSHTFSNSLSLPLSLPASPLSLSDPFVSFSVIIFRKWGNFARETGDLIARQPFGEEEVVLNYLQEQNIFLPWNGTFVHLPRHMLNRVKNNSESSSLHSNHSGKVIPTAEYMIDVILLPSPGEQFSLHISCFDEVFNEAKTTIFAQVSGQNFKSCKCFYNSLKDSNLVLSELFQSKFSPFSPIRNKEATAGSGKTQPPNGPCQSERSPKASSHEADSFKPAEWSERLTPGQSGWLGAAVVGSIPARALSLFLQRLYFLLILQRPYLSLRGVRSAAILFYVLHRFVLAASSACFFPFFLPPPNPQIDRARRSRR